MSNIYPGGDHQYSTNLGLGLWGTDEVTTDNFLLIDAAIGAGSSVRINGSVISNPNFVNSASVTFSVIGSNVSATAAVGSSAWSALTGTLSNGQVIPYADAGISRLAPASLAIGNGTTGDVTGQLTLGTVTAGSSTASSQFGPGPYTTTNEYNATPTVQIQAGTGLNPLEIHAANAVGIDLYVHSNTFFRAPTVTKLRSRGTQSAPLAVQSGDTLANLLFGGYDGTGYQANSYFTSNATENWTPTTTGSDFGISVVQNGTTLSTAALSIGNNTFVGIGPTVTVPLFQLQTTGGNAVNLGTTNAAPTDANLQTLSIVPYLDEVGQNLKIRIKSSTATLFTAVVPYTSNGTEVANTVWAGPTSGAAAVPTFRTLVSADIPNNAANTTGTASNLSGTPALPNGTTATTQALGDNTTKIATDAFVLANSLTNPMTTAGDIIYENATPVPARLPIGTNGYILTVSAGVPSWAPPSASTAAPWSTLSGDLTETQVIPFDGGTIGTPDTGISRIAAATVAIGNGTTGNTSGTITANLFVSSSLGMLAAPIFKWAISGGAVYGFGDDGTVWGPGAPTIWFNGTRGLTFNGTSAMALASGMSIQWATSINASAATNTNISRLANGILGFGNGTAGNSGGTLLASVYGFGATTSAASADTGTSRVSAGVVGIGTGAAGSIAGNLSYNRVNTAGSDFAGQATVTAGNTTKAVAFANNYTGTGQPVIVVTPTSDPLALGVPVGYWVTYSGGAGAWTGWTLNIQTALAGNVTFNYVVIGIA